MSSRSSRIIRKYLDKFFTSFERRFPKLFEICFDPDPEAHRKPRTVLAIALGCLLGLFIYWLIISDLQFDRLHELALAAFVTFVLAFGCAKSLQFRCICLLALPGFFSSAGRSVLKALVLGYIIAGPLFNLTYNAKEVIRCFACTGQLGYNLTKTKYDLMMAPFHEAIESMKENEEEIKHTIKSIDELVEPIKQEIEGEEELEQLELENDALDANTSEIISGKKKLRSEENREQAEQEEDQAQTPGEFYEAKYREKIRARCEYQLTKGSLKCREAFQGAYDKCFDVVTWVAGWVLCWPMKLTFVCDLTVALGGRKICDPKGNIEPGIGEGYVALLETRDKLVANLSITDVRLVSTKKEEIEQEVKKASRAAIGVVKDFESRRRIFVYLILLVKRFLSLVLLKVIYNANKYHKKYLGDIEFDNVYITPYFMRIEARRRDRGSATLMPLKKLERVKIIDPFGLRQSPREKKDLLGQTAKLLLEVMTTSTFILLDKILYEVLDTARNQGQLEITQEGHHDVTLEIYGKGLVASLVRALVRGINRKRKIRNLVTNEACLPRPSRLSSFMLFSIYFTYFLVWFTLLTEAYVMRLRSCFAGYFYRRRDKRRTLYLYNETLRRRVSYIRFARARVNRLARARLLEPESKPWLWLRHKWPRWFDWLGWFECARRTCSICADPEESRKQQHHVCTGEGCYVAYCPDCWEDVGKNCLVCEQVFDSDTSAELDDYYEPKKIR